MTDGVGGTRTARLRLAPRREPYWRTIQEGRAIGYRRLGGGKAGTWIARHYQTGEGRQYKALGAADDMLDADGSLTLNFGQAQEKARAWFAETGRKAGHVVEPLTVRQAMADYIDDYTARGGKALADLRITISAHILPALGDKLVADLAFAALRRWHHKLADAPARLRTRATAEKANVRHADTEDAKRARRATANRVLTVLKAALALAYREGRAHADDAWRRVKPFRKVDAPRVRYLTEPGRVDRAGGIAVRLIDADNYYVLRANALEDNVNFYHVVRGSRRQIHGVDTKVASDQWHTLSLIAAGDQFTIGFNDRTLFRVTEPAAISSSRFMPLISNTGAAGHSSVASLTWIAFNRRNAPP